MALVTTLPAYLYWESIDKLTLSRKAVTLRSRYNARRQTVNFPFAIWQTEGKLVPVDGADAGEWRSFLAELEGQANTFRLPVPGYAAPSTGFLGDALVVGIPAAGAKSMQVNSMTPNSPVLRRGDYFTVNDELKLCTASFVSPADPSDSATITFEPALRKPVANGTLVHFQNPYILVHAMDDDVASWSLSRPVQHGISLKLIEAFDL